LAGLKKTKAPEPKPKRFLVFGRSKPKREEKDPELVKYEQHLKDVGAIEKRNWFSVFVKVLFAVWVIGLIAFIFVYLTTGLQFVFVPQYNPPLHPSPLI